MNISRAVEGNLTASGAFQAQQEVDGDMAIVERVQAGDVRAFDQLVRKYRKQLFSVAYNLTSNREDAYDLTQEAFVKAFRSINSFKGNSAFFTWLYRIAINSTLNFLKRNRFRNFFSFENIQENATSQEIVRALVARSKTEKIVLLNELQEKLNEALQKLSHRHKTVLVLFEIEGLSHQEISEIVGCSIGTVRSRLHYAKQQMQAYLREYLD